MTLSRLGPAGVRIWTSLGFAVYRPNPHQVDAVMFALGRLTEGGCILADEVGLGKTIEAGLVLAQLRAEGKRRLLIIVPKPLIGPVAD